MDKKLLVIDFFFDEMEFISIKMDLMMMKDKFWDGTVAWVSRIHTKIA